MQKATIYLAFLVVCFVLFSFNQLVFAKHPAADPPAKAQTKASHSVEALAPPADKVYSVAEVAQRLKDDPASLKKRQIKLEAYTIDECRGMGCCHYCMLIDKSDKEKFKSAQKIVYDGKTPQAERDAALKVMKSIPAIYTAPSIVIEGPVCRHPGVHGIYVGHFFDEELMKHCEDSAERFFVDKQLEELVSDVKPVFQEITIPTGCLIVDGIGIQPPTHVVLKEHKIFVNGVRFEPSPSAPEPPLTEGIDERRQMDYDGLVGALKKGHFIAVVGDRAEGGFSSKFAPDVLNKIDAIVKDSKPRAQKIEALAKLLQVDLKTHQMFIEPILKNWRIARDK